MSRPKTPILGFVVLIVILMMVSTAYSQCTTSANLVQLQRVTFQNPVDRYSTTAGVTMDATGFTLAPPAGSAAAVSFQTKVNLASGVKLQFSYSRPLNTNVHSGFAVMFQNERYDSRDGSNQHLGYRVPGAMAVEFDYFKNDGDCDAPHVMFAAGASATIAPSYACANYNAASVATQTASYAKTLSGTTAMTNGSAATVAVVLEILKSTSTTGYDISITFDGGSPVILANRLFPSAMDSAGAAWIGFTSSSVDSAAAPAIRFTNISLSTAGVKSGTVVGATNKPSAATSLYTDTTAYNSRIQLTDRCGASVKSITEELQQLSLQYINLPSSTAGDCSMRPFEPTVAGSLVEYRASIGCKKITPTVAGTLDTQLSLTYGNVSGTVTVALDLKFISGPAVARESKIKCVQVLPATACVTTASVVAGTTLSVELNLFDQFGNVLSTGYNINTDASVALNPTPGSVVKTFSNVNTGIITFVPQIVTPNNTPSLLSVTLNNQALTNGAPTLTITPALPSALNTVITGGTGLAQYEAGTPYSFTVGLKDAYGNVCNASTGLEFTVMAYNSVTATACTTANKDTIGFVEGCPAAFTFSSSAGTATLTNVIPTKQQTYVIVCKVNGNRCQGLSLDAGYEISVVPTVENLPSTRLTSSNSAVREVLRSSTVNRANYPTATTAVDYLTVGSPVSLTIQSFDKYGNERSTLSNSGSTYVIRIGADKIFCNGAATIGGTWIRAANSRCRFSASGYQIDIVPQKSSYWVDINTAANIFAVEVSNNDSANTTPTTDLYSNYKYHALVEAALPDPSQTTLSALPIDHSTGARITAAGVYIAGDVITYNLQMQDSSNNYIKPLYKAEAQNDDPQQLFFHVTHTLATLKPNFNPAPINPITTDGNTRARWLFSEATQTWSTTFTLRGAVDTFPTVYFKSSLWKINAFQVAPQIPDAAHTVVTTSYAKPAAIAQWTVNYALFDVYDNPSYFQSNPPSPTTLLKAGLTDACPKNSGDGMTSAANFCSVSSGNGIPTAASFFKCTVVYDNTSVFPTPESCETQPVPNLTNASNGKTVVVWPSSEINNIAVQLAVSTQATTPPTAWLSTITATDPNAITAGSYLWLRFISDKTLTSALFSPGFDQTYPALQTFPSSSDPKMVYLVLRMTQSIDVLKIAPTYAGGGMVFGTTPGNPGVTTPVEVLVKPANVSLQYSTITVPAEMVACDTTPVGGNLVELEPYDQFRNPVPTTHASLAAAQTLIQCTDCVATRAVVGAKITWKLCTKKADYLQFSVESPSIDGTAIKQNEPQLTVFIPAAPLKFVFEPGLSATCLNSGDSCTQCTSGSQCTVRVQLLDAFDNVLPESEINKRGTITSVPLPAIAGTASISSQTAECTVTQVNTRRNAVKNQIAPATTLQQDTTTPGTVSISSNTITAYFDEDTFVVPSITYFQTTQLVSCQAYKLAQFTFTSGTCSSCSPGTLPSSAVANTFNIYASEQAQPTWYSLTVGSTQKYTTAADNGAVVSFTSTPFAADSVGNRFQFTFFDSLFNIWAPTPSQITGNFQSSPNPAVPLINEATATAVQLTTLPVFAKKGVFTLTKVFVSGTPLPGVVVSVTAGPISRWDFTFPSYGKQYRASGTNSATEPTDPSADFYVNATPYDANNNIVTTGVVAAANLLQLAVFEGSTTCQNSIPSETTSAGSLAITDHKFTLKAFDRSSPDDGPTTIQISTRRANTLTQAGTRATYTYYFRRGSTSQVHTCTGATVSIVPNVVSTTLSTVTGVDSSVRAGQFLHFSVTLRDAYSNIIAYNPDQTGVDETDYEYSIESCAGNGSDVYCPQGSPTPGDPECSTVRTGFTGADFSIGGTVQDLSQSATPNVSFLVNVVKDSVRTLIGESCYAVEVYHSFPVTVDFVVSDSPLKPDGKLNTVPDGSSLSMTAGVPQLFSLASTDQYLNIVNYNRSPFEDPAGLDKLFYQTFEVNQFYYIVTATFVKPFTGSSDLIYSTSVTSVFPIFNPFTSTTPAVVQTVTLIPAWPGIYSLSAQAYNSVTNEPLPGDGRLYVELSVHVSLEANPPICTDDKTYLPNPTDYTRYGSCVLRAPTDSFSCYSSGSWSTIDISTYPLVDNQNGQACSCAVGFNQCGSRCIPVGSPSTCADLKPAPARVCPANYFLCGDLTTCAPTAALCSTRIVSCPTSTPHLCHDGSCSISEATCPTATTCPTDEKLCPDGLCVANGEYCAQIRECNPDPDGNPLISCPNDGSCVTQLSQCPNSFNCPLGNVKCDSGECAPSLSQCTPASVCTGDRPYRCPSGSCVVDAPFCSSGLSCGTEKPFLCPDKRSCVSDVDDCNVVQSCPEGTILCASGDCKVQAECPSSPTCRPEKPVMCVNGQCVSSKSECNVIDRSTITCTAAAPHRCSSGRCVKNAALCDALIQCPFYKPILCSTGQCVSAIEYCTPLIDTTSFDCPSDYVKCPVSGSCAKYSQWCPTMRACLDGEIRCANGQCYPVLTDQLDSCPAQARNILQCPTGTVQCPITNTGAMCRPSISECPTDVTCPADAPFRCESNQCASSPTDCSHMDADQIPDTRIACGMGTWASSASLCGTPPTCPRSQPILCLDGTCRQTPEDCPVNNECPTNLPFKCASGECQLNSYSCSLSKCSDPAKPVRCPYSTATTRCVATVNDCPNIFDSNLISSFTSLCTFGARCWDGSCVSESRLCPARRCPSEAPFLCPNGGCAKSTKFCNSAVGCPFDAPFFCKVTAGCVKLESDCITEVDGKPVGCPDVITTNAETGEQIITPSTLTLCSDGTCHANPDDCFLTGPFGCPPETPLRCADGSCVAAITTANPVSQCQLASDLHNACPADRPIRCPGGLCSTSLSRCPSFPSLVSATQVAGICRSIEITEKDENDKDVKITLHMTVTCDDGSCAFSKAECPIIKSCGAKQIRCGDGTCRDLPCDPMIGAECREKYQNSDYMGAYCPPINTCPPQLPYRCQSGECATTREECISLYPLRLLRCCTGGLYVPSSGRWNPQGEDLGTCTASDVVCVDDPRTLETRQGCPTGMVRCERGQCVPSSMGVDLCSIYEQAFDNLAYQSQTCAVRCPGSNKCVDDIAQCTVDNGCPLSTPNICSNGKCVEDLSTCDESDICDLRCPGNGKCVSSLSECLTPLGCPLSTPFLCADGTCKTYPASQKGMTDFPYEAIAPVGIATDVCQPALTCSGSTPFLCADGSCQFDATHCPPVIATCPGVCRVTCPLTNTCVQLQSLSINGVTVCDFDSLIEQCQVADDESCPATRPFLCPSGHCVSQPTQCSSPIFNNARTKNCPASSPFRCVTGGCAVRPFDCIKFTQQIQQVAEDGTIPEFNQDTQISNTNVCKSAYVCPDGSCVKDAPDCAPIEACPFGYKRCSDGSCAAPIRVGTDEPPVWDQGKCLIDDDVDTPFGTCPGGHPRCADGTCRPTGTCPQLNGCDIETPISCPWIATNRCVKTIAECPGFNPDKEESFMISSISLLSAYKPSELWRFDELSTRFPQLNMAKISTLADEMDLTSSFQVQQVNGVVFAPAQTQVQTCYSNCERDLAATPSTTIITPSTTVSGLAISQNQYAIPRSTISIPTGAVNRTAEFRIYQTPEQLFSVAKTNELSFGTALSWSEPVKKRDSKLTPQPTEFAKVISTPFACSLQINQTAIQPQLAMTVSAYVDTKAYRTVNQGSEVVETEFPCAFLGEYDSALVGQGCGGIATISGATMEIRYDNSLCKWENASDQLNVRASFVAVKTAEEVPDSIPWNGQTARQVICMRVDSSTRKFASGESIVGSEFCATFVRITDLVQITLPNNFMVEPNTTTNLLTPENFAESKTTPPNDADLQTISNALLYDPTASTKTCSTASSDVSQIAKQDICLGYYDYATYTWSCVNPLNEQRLAAPTWVSGMRLNQATAALDSCDKDAYAFLYVPLPDPVPVEEKFCFWCKYGWIILLCCIIFVVLLLIVLFFAMKFYADRMKYKEEQRKLKNLQEHASDLAENQGGLGVADADGEINMTVNPLVLQLQDLNKQLEDANLKLDTIGKEEEYHIQRLQQQRARIQAEIKRLEESLAHDETVKLAPKRVDTPVTGGPTAIGGPQGPVRTGGQGPSGPTAIGNASGPMRAPQK
jgi:hypothetical protein